VSLDSFRAEQLDDGTAVAVVCGDLDLGIAREFPEWVKGHLPDGWARRLVVDLTEMGYMDSSGLAALLAVWRQVQDGGGSVVIVAPGDALFQRFEIRGVTGILSIAGSRGEAVEILTQTPA
jgi:anti-anti-sigma factor